MHERTTKISPTTIIDVYAVCMMEAGLHMRYEVTSHTCLCISFHSRLVRQIKVYQSWEKSKNNESAKCNFTNISCYTVYSFSYDS